MEMAWHVHPMSAQIPSQAPRHGDRGCENCRFWLLALFSHESVPHLTTLPPPQKALVHFPSIIYTTVSLMDRARYSNLDTAVACTHQYGNQRYHCSLHRCNYLSRPTLIWIPALGISGICLQIPSRPSLARHSVSHRWLWRRKPTDKLDRSSPWSYRCRKCIEGIFR